MVVDYGTLKTWKTPDLLLRESRLVKRTQVMGMSQPEAIIHIVALVVTSGSSLPINLAFCVWQGYRYVKVKEERMWIRQILRSRNVLYQGRGQYVHADNDPQKQFPQANSNAAGNDLKKDSGKDDTFEKLSCIVQVLSLCVTPQGTT